MALTDYVDFTNNYLVKNGMIGNATNFNKSIDKLKLEVDELNTTKVQKVSSTDSAIPRFDGTSGDLKNSIVTINDSGVITGSLNGNAGTATALQTARLIGGVSFNGTSDITLPGVNATGNQSTTGNAATATKLQTTRNIALTGDVTGNVNFDGSANVSIAATIAANSVALGTDTTGNYVAGVTQGTGISVTGTAGEGWTPVVSLTNVGTAGTYRSVTTDAQGRVTAGTNPTTLSGYGITDAQTASRTSATFTTAANTWYRIATSVVGIERNSAEFVVDWTVGSNHGSTRFAAACHYGESAGVSLMQTNYAKYGTGGITEARIVYHTTFTGNYAYVEVKFAAALTSVVVDVEMQDPLGWTLVTPSTAGSIPSGYSSYVHTFVPSAAITAGTYPKVTINQEGRVISGSAMLATDIPDLDASKITTGTLPVVRGGTGVTTSTGTGSVVLSTSPTLTTPNIGVATGTSFNSITGLASVAPIVAGTAAVGTSTLTARQDHVHPAQTTITGNAGTATTLQTARTIGASGDVTGTDTSFNGSANITIPMTLANSGVTAGTYSKVTVDAKGRVTAGLTPTMEDIPDATFKRSVRCATTANIAATYASNVLTASAVGVTVIDGITVALNDRVLIKDQTTPAHNGIYRVSVLGTASVATVFTRTTDADSITKIASALVAVDSGTVNGGKLFDNDLKTTDTLGTTAMTWATNLDDGSLLTAGSTSVGIVKYNGTTAAAGQFDGGTTTPTGTTRLNFGGYFYPTYINLTGSTDTTTASSHVFVETGSDGYVRPKTLANFKTEIFASPTLVTPNIGVATGTSFNSITGLSSTTPLMDGTAAVGTGVTVARADHVHPTDTSRAPLVSPAFTGTPTAPTPAQFDNDASIATTAFVRSELGSFAGIATEYTTSTTIPPSDVGKQIFFQNSSSVFTLPLVSSCRNGAVIHFSGNFSGGTISRQGSDLMEIGHGGNVTSVSLSAVDTASFIAVNGSWYLSGGTLFNKYYTGFLKSFDTSGYQRLPSGLIIQWGRLPGVSGNRVFTLPITFPNSTLSATFSEASTSGTAAVTAQLRTLTSSDITIYVGSSNTLSIFAIGY